MNFTYVFFLVVSIFTDLLPVPVMQDNILTVQIICGRHMRVKFHIHTNQLRCLLCLEIKINICAISIFKEQLTIYTIYEYLYWSEFVYPSTTCPVKLLPIQNGFYQSKRWVDESRDKAIMVTVLRDQCITPCKLLTKPSSDISTWGPMSTVHTPVTGANEDKFG